MANPSSDAVFVGAGNPPSGIHGRTPVNPGWNETYVDRARCGFSNYGSRVDCQGWGFEVTSTGYGSLQGGGSRDLWYTDTFSGTSSASPIVTGVLGCGNRSGGRRRGVKDPLCLQGILRSCGVMRSIWSMPAARMRSRR